MNVLIRAKFSTALQWSLPKATAHSLIISLTVLGIYVQALGTVRKFNSVTRYTENARMYERWVLLQTVVEPRDSNGSTISENQYARKYDEARFYIM